MAVRKGWEERDLVRGIMRKHDPWEGRVFTDSNRRSEEVRISARWRGTDTEKLDKVTRELRERLPGKVVRVRPSVSYVTWTDGLIRVTVIL
jgi:hypothetical protein